MEKGTPFALWYQPGAVASLPGEGFLHSMYITVMRCGEAGPEEGMRRSRAMSTTSWAAAPLPSESAAADQHMRAA